MAYSPSTYDRPLLAQPHHSHTACAICRILHHRPTLPRCLPVQVGKKKFSRAACTNQIILQRLHVQSSGACGQDSNEHLTVSSPQTQPSHPTPDALLVSPRLPVFRLNRALPGLSHSASASSNVSTSGNLANLWGALSAALGVQGLEGQAVGDILPLGDQIKLPAHVSEKSGPSIEENMVSALSRSAMMLRQDVWEGPADIDGFSSLRDHALEVLANGKKDPGAKGGGRDWGKNSTAGENATSSAGWDVDDKVVTDDDIEWGMGLNGKQWYIPGYITAMVGKNYLRAPGYLGVLVSFTAVFFVSATLKEGPRKYLSQHVPLAQLNPRALSCFTPLSACVGLETAAQFCTVMMEMAVPAIVGMWMAWTTDAKAIYMMGLSCLGIIGYAVLEPFRVWFPLRHLMLGSVLVLAMGIVQAVSWDGKLNIGRYTLGLSLISIATAPLSTICTQVVNKAVIKTYSEEGAMVWGQLFWSITSVPARTLGPIVFAYSIEMDESGGLGYMCLLAVALVAIGILVFFQSQLITPQVGEDAEVLPGSEPTITGDGVNMTRYAPLSP